MPANIETRIFKLRHDPQTSERLGYLVSQQRLAYNYAVNVLNRTPGIAARRSPRHPDGLLGQLTRWRHRESRADAPYIIHQAGAQQAWMANDLMRRERQARLIRLGNGSNKSSDHRQHRRTLARRSRKHGSSTLTSLTPPIRLDDDTFTIMGARDVVLRTKKPVPKELDIRSFQLVEIRQDSRGLNGALRDRRYALHLQVAVNYPDPPALDAIEAPDEILGIDDGVKKHVALSNNEFIHIDEAEAIHRERQARIRASRKKRRSKRQKALLRETRKSSRVRRANRRQILTIQAKHIYQELKPKAIAIEKKSVKAMARSARGTKDNPGRGVRAKSRLNRAMQDAALSEHIAIMAREALKAGLGIYPVWPQGSSQTCSSCGYRHRNNRESQAVFRCLECGYEANADSNAARILRNRAFHYVGAATGRTVYVEQAPTGWRMQPSGCGFNSNTKSVFKPKGGSRRHNVAGREATYASGSAISSRSDIDIGIDARR